MAPDHDTSKFLSYVLRHKPDSIGVELDAAGWVEIELLIDAGQKNGREITINELRLLVENNSKKRFEISDDGKKIRASQGHSLQVDLGYKPMIPPDVLYHGTATRFVESIQKSGLQKRERHHVHMTSSIETATEVGSRYGKAIVLKVLSAKMYEEGYVFYQSANGVWLTQSVPAQFIDFGGI